MTTATEKSTTYHHGDLRNALLRAALELIAEDGATSLSLRAVARRAGVSSAAPYRHFSNRNSLLAEVATQGFRLLTASIRSQMASATTSASRLVESGVGYVAFAIANPAHYSVMFLSEFTDNHAYPELALAAAESLRQLTAAIERCAAEGLLQSADVRDMAMVAWSGVHGFSSLVSSGQLKVLAHSGQSVLDRARILSRSLLLGFGG